MSFTRCDNQSLNEFKVHKFRSNIYKTLWNFVRILMTKHECS